MRPIYYFPRAVCLKISVPSGRCRHRQKTQTADSRARSNHHRLRAGGTALLAVMRLITAVAAPAAVPSGEGAGAVRWLTSKAEYAMGLGLRRPFNNSQSPNARCSSAASPLGRKPRRMYVLTQDTVDTGTSKQPRTACASSFGAAAVCLIWPHRHLVVWRPSARHDCASQPAIFPRRAIMAQPARSRRHAASSLAGARPGKSDEKLTIKRAASESLQRASSRSQEPAAPSQKPHPRRLRLPTHVAPSLRHRNRAKPAVWFRLGLPLSPIPCLPSRLSTAHPPTLRRLKL